MCQAVLERHTCLWLWQAVKLLNYNINPLSSNTIMLVWHCEAVWCTAWKLKKNVSQGLNPWGMLSIEALKFTVYYRAAIAVMWGDACPFHRETLFCQQCRDSAMVWRENPSDLLNLISACSWGTSNVDKGVSVHCASSYNRFLWAALLLAVNRTERDIFARLQIVFEIQMRGHMQMHGCSSVPFPYVCGC